MGNELKKLSDDELILRIKSSNENERNGALRYLYREIYPVIESFVAMNSGTSPQAKDLFQEALLTFYEKMVDKDLELSCKISTYIYSICRRMWLDKLRTEKNHQRILNDMLPFIEISESISSDLEYTDSNSNLQKLLKDLSAKCKTILIQYYYHNQSMRVIAEMVNYKSEHVAKNEKLRCLKRLREMIGNDKSLLESLFNYSA